MAVNQQRKSQHAEQDAHVAHTGGLLVNVGQREKVVAQFGASFFEFCLIEMFFDTPADCWTDGFVSHAGA